MTREANWIVILALTFVAGAGCLCAEENVEELEARYAAAFQSFKTETRSELTRIALDKSLTGEEKILRTEAWFATHAQRMAEIDAMADTLDELKPIPRTPRPVRPADPTPEGMAAAGIHHLNARLAKGEITVEEFDHLRKPHIDQLNALHERAQPTPRRLPPPPFDPTLNAQSSEQEIAAALHAQYRYLASLPEQEAADIREDRQSLVNRILLILDQRERFSESSISTTSENHKQHSNQ